MTIDPEFNIKKKIEEISELPAMPEMAEKIILLKANPYAKARDLAELIKIDPSLSAQIISYAKSPFFGYRSEVNSIQHAISRVLGYDMVMNIALGLATAAPFKIPRKGPLGLDAFWQHAIYSATLSQMIGKLLPQEIRPNSGMTYLAGLLHNFGFLMLGHLFLEQFSELNKNIGNNQSKTVMEHEHELLNVNHTTIGAWLMQAWNMPPAIITTIKEHHNEDFRGDDSNYVHVVLLANRLLRAQGYGDAENTAIPVHILKSFGLNETQLHDCVESMFNEIESLNKIIKLLAA